jgi:hypothetical protein
VAGPFLGPIKGTTAGTPGTGAFTPNAASSGFLAWSTVYSGWIGLVRFEEGTSWELRYSYWNGTTLSRGANAFVSSSSGSGLSLTSAATAAMVVDGAEVNPHIGGAHWSGFVAQTGVNALSTIGMAAQTNTGTAALSAIATTNYLTEQPREQWTSATTANAQAGVSSPARGFYSTATGRGGLEFVTRFGASQLPTGPRLFVGLTSTTFVGNTGEDSSDTNSQLLTNSNAGSGTKIDTGIPLVATGWYEASIWFDPGGGRVYGLLIRLDTGDIYYGSTTSDLPANGAAMIPNVLGGLSSTTGTAFIIHVGSMMTRVGG